MKAGSNVKDEDDTVQSNVRDDIGIYNQNNPDEDEYAIIPPNGGWGWLIVFSAFYCNIITDGIQLTFGLFLRSIADYFETAKSNISLLGSLMFGVHLLVGPFCSGLNNMCGIRPIAFTGSILTACGIAICYFSPNYQFMYFFYGVLGGIGLGMIYMNTIIITSIYFTSLRILALGIVVCGTGCGTVAFSLLGNELLKVLSWQTSFLVEAALAGSMGLAALTFRPLKPRKIVFTTNQTLLKEKNSVISRVSAVSKQASKFSVYTDIGSTATRNKRATVYIKKDLNARSSASIRTVAIEKLVHKTILQELAARICKLKCCKCKCRRQASVIYYHPAEKEENFEEYLDVSLPASPVQSLNNSFDSPIPSMPPNSVTASHERSNTCCNCTPMKKTVGMIFDCKLLRSYAFLMYCTSGAFAMASLLIVLIYEKDMSVEVHGFSEDTATYLLVALGGANTFWRLFLGLLSTGIKINKVKISIVFTFIGSVSMVASTVWANIYFQYSCIILIASGMASFAVFRPVILIDLVGSDLLINASGISLLFMGAISIISPPLSGLAMEVTHDYNIIYYTAGALHAISGLLLIKIYKVRDYDLERFHGHIV